MSGGIPCPWCHVGSYTKIGIHLSRCQEVAKLSEGGLTRRIGEIAYEQVFNLALEQALQEEAEREREAQEQEEEERRARIEVRFLRPQYDLSLIIYIRRKEDETRPSRSHHTAVSAEHDARPADSRTWYRQAPDISLGTFPGSRNPHPPPSQPLKTMQMTRTRTKAPNLVFRPQGQM